MRRVRTMVDLLSRGTARSMQNICAHLLPHWAPGNGLSYILAAQRVGLISDAGGKRKSHRMSVRDAAALLLMGLAWPGQPKKGAEAITEAAGLMVHHVSPYGGPFVLTPEGYDALPVGWTKWRLGDAFSALLAALIAGGVLRTGVEGGVTVRPSSEEHPGFSAEIRAATAEKSLCRLAYYGPKTLSGRTWVTVESHISLAHLARAADFLAGRSDHVV